MNDTLEILQRIKSFENLINLFRDNICLKTSIEQIKDPTVRLKLLDLRLDVVSKIFKSEDHLNQILKKQIDDITDEDLIDLLLSANGRYKLLEINSNNFSLRIHGLLEHEGSPIFISFGSIYFIQNFTEHIYISKTERERLIYAIFGLYKFYSRTDNCQFNIYDFIMNGNIESNFWDNLATYIADKEPDHLNSINFDKSEMTLEVYNISKSKGVINKYAL